MPAYAPDIYTADGSTTDFAITFEYDTSRPSSIVVVAGGETQTISVDYTLPNPQLVRFNSAPTGGDRVVISRSTSLVDIPVDWEDEDRLTETLHDLQDRSAFWRDQELAVLAGMQKDSATGQWDGESLRITDVSDPINAQDVVTLSYLQDYISGGQTGVSGIYRVTGTGDGVTTTITLLPADSGSLSDVEQVELNYDGLLVDPADYAISPDGRGITLDDPIPNGVFYDARVLTASLTVLSEGAVDPSNIALAEGKLIRGDSGGVGEAIDVSDISLSDLAAPTGDLSMGSKKITNLADPTASAQAATKSYVDGLHTSKAPFSTIGSRTAYTLNTGIPNSSAKTALVTIEWVGTAGYGSQKELFVETASDSGFSSNLVTRSVIFPQSNRISEFVTIFVPGGYYWRLRSSDTFGNHTFFYQTASTPA